MSSENSVTNPTIKNEPNVKNEPIDMSTSSTSGQNPSAATNSAVSSAKKVSKDVC